jgi:hypothetical protein
MLRIITNNHWNQFKYGHEVPEAVLADFDYLDDDDKADGFIHYRNRWYHTSDFMRIDKSMNDHNGWDRWHGYHGDSFFSGVLIELSDDGEAYRIGTYLS